MLFRSILPVLVMFVVTAVETVGDISGVMEGGMGREATDKELSGGVMCDGLGSTLAAMFGVLPNTCLLYTSYDAAYDYQYCGKGNDSFTEKSGGKLIWKQLWSVCRSRRIAVKRSKPPCGNR